MALHENMQLIRVQRELQEKKNNITMTEAQLNQISTSLQATEAANRELVSSLEHTQRELQASEANIGLLQTELAVAAGNKLKLVSVSIVSSQNICSATFATVPYTEVDNCSIHYYEYHSRPNLASLPHT